MVVLLELNTSLILDSIVNRIEEMRQSHKSLSSFFKVEFPISKHLHHPALLCIKIFIHVLKERSKQIRVKQGKDNDLQK